MVEMTREEEGLRKYSTSFQQDKKGYILLEALIALAVVGAVTFMIVNSDILPGLRDKWSLQRSIIQNNWIQ